MAATYPTVPGVTFKSITDLDGYCFGDDGSAWSRWVAGHAGYLGGWHRIKGHVRPDGYVDISVKIAGKNSDRRLHRLVLEAFVGPCPEGMEARHVNDNDRGNNRLDNLCWGTPKENTEDRRRHGTMARGERIGCAKLSGAKVAEMYDMFEAGHLICEIADRFGVDPSMTSKILRGRYWADAVPGRKPPLSGDARQRGAIAREQRRKSG